MALKIRLRQQGRTNRHTFRLVVIDSRFPREGKYLEKVGHYLPFEKSDKIQVNEERLSYWLSQGAELSDSAENLVAKVAPALIKELRAKQVQAQLKAAAKRKARKGKKKEAVVPSAEKKAAPKKGATKKTAARKSTAKKKEEAPAAE